MRPQQWNAKPSQLLRLYSRGFLETAEARLTSSATAWVGPAVCDDCILACDDQCPPKEQSPQEPVVSNLRDELAGWKDHYLSVLLPSFKKAKRIFRVLHKHREPRE